MVHQLILIYIAHIGADYLPPDHGGVEGPDYTVPASATVAAMVQELSPLHNRARAVHILSRSIIACRYLPNDSTTSATTIGRNTMHAHAPRYTLGDAR
jgi:hypothetical protein